MKIIENLFGILLLVMAVAGAELGIRYGGPLGISLVVCDVLFVAHFQYYWRKDEMTAPFANSALCGMDFFAMLGCLFLILCEKQEKEIEDLFGMVLTYALIVVGIIFFFFLYVRWIIKDFANYRKSRAEEKSREADQRAEAEL